MNDSNFDWITWRNGNITDFGFPCREHFILSNKRILREHAVGYCEAERLLCRPKKNCYAVMFLLNGVFFWTHLTNKEFKIVFKGVIK